MPAGSKKPVPVYLRGISAALVREAKAQAALRGVTLAGYVAETLERALHPPTASRGESGDAPVDDLSAEARWYEQNRGLISRRYGGQFVAIVGQKILDHDVSFEHLAERMFKLRGPVSTFMPQVRTSERVVRIRSPRKTRGE
jgi:hypothetical protein